MADKLDLKDVRFPVVVNYGAGWGGLSIVGMDTPDGIKLIVDGRLDDFSKEDESLYLDIVTAVKALFDRLEENQAVKAEMARVEPTMPESLLDSDEAKKARETVVKNREEAEKAAAPAPAKTSEPTMPKGSTTPEKK